MWCSLYEPADYNCYHTCLWMLFPPLQRPGGDLVNATSAHIFFQSNQTLLMKFRPRPARGWRRGKFSLSGRRCHSAVITFIKRNRTNWKCGSRRTIENVLAVSESEWLKCWVRNCRAETHTWHERVGRRIERVSQKKREKTIKNGANQSAWDTKVRVGCSMGLPIDMNDDEEPKWV